MRAAILTTDGREHLREPMERPSFGLAPEALLQGLAVQSGLEVHVISCTAKPMRSPDKLADNIFFHSLYVPKTGWMRTLYQGCIRAVRKKLKEIRPDIVHGQGTERDCAISAVFSGYPNVLTLHGNMRLIARVNRARLFSFGWLAAQLERFTVPRTDGVVCITRYTRDAVAGLAKRTWLVPNAVDAEFLEILNVPDRNEHPIILCVGLVCPRKNQNAFIRSLDPLALDRKFKVVFLGNAAGGRSYDDEFFDLLKSRPWCLHAGFAVREQLKIWFQRASVLALPSLEDNCPLVVLEAMAAGVPVLAANVGGVPDLIEDGKNGLLCDPLDPASMRAGVARLLEAPGLGRQLAAEAKQRARTRFHPEVIARRHIEIYREVLGGGGA